MSRLLVVDDEDKIRLVIREYAEFEGYEVLEAKDGMEAVNLAKEEDFDLIIMDVMMPRLDGFSACKEILKNKFIPILMLSARSDEFDKLFGFELGIDDYVIKPFSPKELMARAKVIINRNNRAKQGQNGESKNGSAANTHNGTKGANGLNALSNTASGMKDTTTPQAEAVQNTLTLDLEAKTVSVNGTRLDLTPKESEILFYLARNNTYCVSKTDIIKNVWGNSFFGSEKTLDAQIRMLRASLSPCNPISNCEKGYKFQWDLSAE